MPGAWSVTEHQVPAPACHPHPTYKGSQSRFNLSIVLQDVAGVLERVAELPFSPVAGNILQLARDERKGAREIARIIAQGRGFTARLLKVANSPITAWTMRPPALSSAPTSILRRTSLERALFSAIGYRPH